MQAVASTDTQVTVDAGGVKMTYKEAADRISLLASGLQALGLAKGDKIGLFSENSYR